MKITDLSILCKWKNLKNRECIKYLFAPLCIYIYKYIYGYIGGGGGYVVVVVNISKIKYML